MAADVIVTVRMPETLTEALRSRLAADHYADISEQVRSIVRRGCLRYAQLLQEGRAKASANAVAEQDASVAGREARIEILFSDLRELLNGGGKR